MLIIGKEPCKGYMDLCVTMDNIRGKRMILHKRMMMSDIMICKKLFSYLDHYSLYSDSSGIASISIECKSYDCNYLIACSSSHSYRKKSFLSSFWPH